MHAIIIPAAWNIHQGHLGIRLSVCLYVHPCVHQSICLQFSPVYKRMQYLKFGWSFSNNKNWTVCSCKGCSHLNDITCPWWWGGSKCRTGRFCHSLTLLPQGGISVSHTHVYWLSDIDLEVWPTFQNFTYTVMIFVRYLSEIRYILNPGNR